MFLEEFNYSRLNIIKNLLADYDIKPLNFCPPFRKRLFIKNFLNRKYVINDFFVSDFDSLVYDRKQAKHYSLRALYYYGIDYVNFRFSKYLLSDTQSHLNYWEKLFGITNAKTFVLPVLADINIYQPNKNDYNNDKLKILFYGTFIPLHGLEVIIKAINILKNDKKLNIEFTLIGSGQELLKIKSLIKQLDLKIDKFIDYRISEDVLVTYINNNDIILGIFGNSKKAKNVIPNKVYQGLACKKCVVTMNSPAIREFFDDSDMLLIDNNEIALSNTIEYLYLNPYKCKYYAEKGYKSFQKLYNNTKISLIHFLEDIKKELK